MIPEKTSTEQKQKTLHQVLSERELDRIKGLNVPDTPFTEVTVGTLMYLSLCLDDGSNLSIVETLSILTKRSWEVA